MSTSDADVTQWGLDQDRGYCRMSKKVVGRNREEQDVSSCQTWCLLKRLRLRKCVSIKCEWTNINKSICQGVHKTG